MIDERNPGENSDQKSMENGPNPAAQNEAEATAQKEDDANSTPVDKSIVDAADGTADNDIKILENEEKPFKSEDREVCEEKEPIIEGGVKVKFDDILADLGDFGSYQKLIYFLLFIPTIFSGMQKQSWVFLGAKTPHRCRLGFEDANATYNNPSLNLSDYIPWNDLDSRLDSCTMFDVDNNTVKCQNGWIYDRSEFGSSAVMDWNLVCENKGMRATAQALFMVGVMIGSKLFGMLSDLAGRKIAFFISVILQAISGILSGIVENYWAFVIIRMIIGATTSGVFLVAYVIAMEMVGPKYRMIAGTLCQYYYTFGYLGMVLVAYLLNHNWHHLQLALTIPIVLFISYWWIIPESVRWLMSKARYSEAKLLLQKAARMNKIELDDSRVEAMFESVKAERQKANEVESKASLKDIAKHKRLLLRTLNLAFSWMVNSGTYYGLALNSSNLGGNPYYNYLISAAVEIPAYAFNLLVLDRPEVGRRRALSGCLLFAGAVLTLTVFVPKDMNALLVFLSMCGKLAITSSYGTVYVFSAELYPTPVRNVGLGFLSMFARVGGILCPYVNMLSDYWTPLPLIIYGALAFSSGVLVLFLPETLGKSLPETLEEGENFGQKSSSQQSDEK